MAAAQHARRRVGGDGLSGLLAALPLALMVSGASANDATWAGPGPDWSNAANWSAPTPPTGTATFAGAAPTFIDIRADATVGTMRFAPGAPSYYGFTIGPAAAFTLDGLGIVNQSVNVPTFDIQGVLEFANAATAGNANLSNDWDIEFYDRSSAADATITNSALGELYFSGLSTAGKAFISNNEGFVSFENASTAGGATINNFGTSGGGPAELDFIDAATAGNATINNQWGIVAFGCGCFADGASAGTATITNNVSGFTLFSGQSTAADATVIANDQGGVFFMNASTGGNARLVANLGGFIDFTDTAGFSLDGVVTAGSIEGAGDFFLPALIANSALFVGSNGLSTTVSGTIWDGCGCEPGALTKVGAGTLTLSGANTYTGATTVAAGTLAIDGSVDSDVTVAGDAILKGTGAMNAVTVLAGGVHAPGNSIGTTFVNSDYTNRGTLEIEFSPTLADLVDVQGAVDVVGGTLHLLPAAGLYGATTTYTIVANDPGDVVTGPFGAITGAAFFDRSVDYAGGDGNDIDVTLVANLNAPASSRNQKQVGGVLQGFFGTSDPAMQSLQSALFGIADEDNARAALDMLSGEVHPGVGGVLLINDRRFLELLAARFRLGSASTDGAPLSYAEDGNQPLAFAGDPLERLSGSAPGGTSAETWATAFGGLDRLDADGNGSGLNAWTGGLAGGYDGMVSAATRLGVAVGYSHEGIALPSRNSTAAVNSGRLAGTLSTEAGAWTFGGVAEYAYHAVDTSRHVVIGGFNRTADAGYGAHQASLYGEVARAFAVAPGTMEPFAGLRYGYLHTGAFAETGAGIANISSAGATYRAFDSVLGFRFTGLLPVGGKTVSPSFRFAWEHAFGATAAAANFTLAGVAFTPAATTEGRDRFVLGSGLAFALSRMTTAELGYAATFAAGRVSQDASARIALRF